VEGTPKEKLFGLQDAKPMSTPMGTNNQLGVDANEYCLSVELTSNYNANSWILSNIYAPCTSTGKRGFITWFKNIQMPDAVNWLIVGDFNLYRSPTDRNRPGGDHNEMYLFNATISSLGVVELPLKGRRYT
jgi:hypothetical protein